jgi:hypothetical protein
LQLLFKYEDYSKEGKPVEIRVESKSKQAGENFLGSDMFSKPGTWQWLQNTIIY